MKKQFSALLLSRGLSSLIQAISLLLFIRWAGVESFGVVAVITSIAAVVYTFADWGASIHIPRSRAKELPELVAGGLAVSVIGNSIAGVVLTVGVLVFTVHEHMSVYLALIPLALAVEQFTEAGLTVSVADRAKRVVFINLIIRRLVMLGVFLGLYSVSVEAVAAYATASFASSVAGVAHLVNDLRTRLRGAGKVRIKGQLWKEFSPYVLENISSSVRHFDTTIVAAASTAQATGFYSAAFRLTKPLNQIGGAATAVLIPHASRSSLAGVKRAAKKLAMLGVLGIVFALVIGIFSNHVVNFLFGAGSDAAGPVFAWALVSIAPVCLAPSLGGLLQGSGHQKFVAVNGLVFGLLTLAGVFWGTLAFGISGAAGALTIAYTLKSVVLGVRIARLADEESMGVVAEGKSGEVSISN